jgi:hypothetical protein
MALEVRDAIGALTATWSRLGHEIGFGIGIAHGFATLGPIGFEGRFDYAAIGTVSNVASRLCDEAKPGQILISPRVLMAVEDAVTVEKVGEFELKGSGDLRRRTMWSLPHRPKFEAECYRLRIARGRYLPNSASAASTRTRKGVRPNWDMIRFASVRCRMASPRFLFAL